MEDRVIRPRPLPVPPVHALPAAAADSPLSLIPEILVTPPSTPSLVYDDYDDTPSTEEESPSLTASTAGWDLTECFQEATPDEGAFMNSERGAFKDEAVDHKGDSALVTIDILFDEVEASVSPELPSELFASIPEEEESSDMASDASIVSDASVPSISDLLEELNGGEGDDVSSLVPDSSCVTEEDAPPLLEVPPVCHTQTDRDTAKANSRYPRFIVTPATIKRSALKSPVKVQWKRFKRTLSLPDFVSGIALNSKNKLTSITEAAKGKTLFVKRVRRDTPYVWPSGDDASEDTKRSSTARF